MSHGAAWTASYRLQPAVQVYAILSEQPIMTPMSPGQVVDATRTWLELAVIGLNLCPFAKAVHVKQQIHYVCSNASSAEALLEDLRIELDGLVTVDPNERDTTLLIAPACLSDFLDFNDFLHLADQLLEDMGLVGVLQIASFHPDFQFAGTTKDDVTNCTNRSPFPMLHLLREDSIDRAVQAFPEAEAIYEKNMQTLTAMGQERWLELAARWAPPPADASGAGVDGRQGVESK
jgi:hypothetical protein